MKLQKTPETPSPRKRRLPNIYDGHHRLDEKLLEILGGYDPKTQVYVYRAKDDWPVPPYLFKCCPFPRLEHRIRDEYGSGQYAIIIRRGEAMILSGTIGIEVPMNWQPKRWGA